MTRLQKVLEAALPDAANLGGGRNVDRDHLTSLLQALSVELGRAFWMRFLIVLLILCICAAAIWRFSGDLQLVLAVVCASVTLFLASLFALKQVTDELAQLQLVQSLAHSISLDALTEIARKIVFKA